MAASDPNGDEPIALAIDRRHVAFLRDYFSGVFVDRLQDLARHRATLSDPEGDEATVAVMDRWRRDLDDHELTGDRAELRNRLLDCLIDVDLANDYGRVIDEHEAFAHVLRRLA